MDSDRRSGAPVLRPKLNRPASGGPDLGQLIRISVLAALAVGVVGVVVAAAVPSIDLFGIYAPRKGSVAAAPEKNAAPPAPAPVTPPPAPPPVAPGSNPPPVAETAVPSTPPPPVGETPAAPNNSNGETNPSAVAPPQPPTTAERSADRDIGLLRDLKPAVALPSITDVGDTTLAYLHEAERIRFDSVKLLPALAALGDDQAFHFERDGDKPRWSIRFTGPPNLASGHSASESAGDGTDNEKTSADSASIAAAPLDVVLADLWCLQSSLMFRWREAARNVPAAEQLRNAAVQFTIAAHRQTLALREPISQPAHLLDLSDRTNDIAATLPHPPRSESLHLEISGIRDMSVNASYQRERNVVPIALAAPAGADKQPQRPPRRTPPAREPAAEPDADEAPERITILFDTLADGQQPQLWIEPRHDGGGDVSIRVAARIVRGKIVDDMTAKSLDLYLLPRQQALASVERDWKNMHDLTVFLDRRIGETRAGINPRESIRSLEVKLRAAQREYQKLDDHLQKLKAELAWAEAAQLLIQTIDKHSRLKYRVFAKSGDLEIDLVHGGLD